MRRTELGCGCSRTMSACGRFGHEVVNSGKMSSSPWVAVGLEAGAGHPMLSPHVDLLQHVVGLEPLPQCGGSRIPTATIRDVQDLQEDICLGRKAATPWDHM